MVSDRPNYEGGSKTSKGGLYVEIVEHLILWLISTNNKTREAFQVENPTPAIRLDDKISGLLTVPERILTRPCRGGGSLRASLFPLVDATP